MFEDLRVASAMKENCCAPSTGMCRPMENLLRIQAMKELTERAFDLGPPAIVAAACWAPAYGVTGIGAVAVAIVAMMVGGRIHRITRRSGFAEERTALVEYVRHAVPLGLTLALIGMALSLNAAAPHQALNTLVPLAGAAAWALAPRLWLVELTHWFAGRLQNASTQDCDGRCATCEKVELAPCRVNTWPRQCQQGCGSACHQGGA